MVILVLRDCKQIISVQSTQKEESLKKISYENICQRIALFTAPKCPYLIRVIIQSLRSSNTFFAVCSVRSFSLYYHTATLSGDDFVLVGTDDFYTSHEFNSRHTSDVTNCKLTHSLLPRAARKLHPSPNGICPSSYLQRGYFKHVKYFSLYR